MVIVEYRLKTEYCYKFCKILQAGGGRVLKLHMREVLTLFDWNKQTLLYSILTRTGLLVKQNFIHRTLGCNCFKNN